MILDSIPICMTAKNEGNHLVQVLNSLFRAVEYAERHSSFNFEIHLVLNDNNDASEEIVADLSRVEVWNTKGGLVEAQRFCANLFQMKDFILFSDADLFFEQDVVLKICQAMIENKDLRVAYAMKEPRPPKKRSLLSRALYTYNKNEGFQTSRNYFNGQFFAIRGWSIPRPQDLTWNENQNNLFYNLDEGIRADDIYLSRALLWESGPQSIFCVSSTVFYQPPETLQGMYRKYQRMTLEIERLHLFFPRSKNTHKTLGRRKLDWTQLGKATTREIFDYTVFVFALRLCQIYYFLEKFYYSKLARKRCPTWKPVIESKNLESFGS